MDNILEKIATYSIGSLAGFVAGMLILLLDVIDKQSAHMSTVVPVATLIGMIISITFLEIKKNRVIKHNQKIRDETVALITHEMRTGLTSTGWAIQFIIQNYSDKLIPADKKMLADVVDSIHTTVMHSVNLLDVSLLDIGKLAIALEWLTLENVERIFEEIVEKYTFGAQAKKIELISNIKLDRDRQVEVDRVRIRIILENLLENAIQYTVGKKRVITVNITNDAKNLYIQVGDTGIGIPKEEQAKIFSEFYRASNARKMLSSGSGIGLYICHQYVTAHRGTIRFESIPDQGTTFFISIPLKTTGDMTGFLTKL